jgi:membrane protein DedA with SNARE-associated domain
MYLLAAISLRWLVRLGGPGLILVGIVDQSFLPVPGAIDAITVILTAGNRNLWPYYWGMATAGALLGAFITYRISKKGGKEALHKRLPRKTIQKVEDAFGKRGFAALFVAALLPPPLPMVPVVVGAGALQYPTRKFLLAVGSGRLIRYGILAWLAHVYGRHIMRVVRSHELLIIVSFLVFSVGAGVTGWLWTRWQKNKEKRSHGGKKKAA